MLMKKQSRTKINRFSIAVLTAAMMFASAYARQMHETKANGKGKEAKAPMLKHEYADVNGVRLHYVTAGKGKLIMFVHGFPEFWYEWKNQLAEFGRDYQAVAPDMRGYNLSSKPADVDQYRVEREADVDSRPQSIPHAVSDLR